MVNDEKVKDAVNTIKSMCRERYGEDEYGDMLCLDCPFYQITDGGYQYCHLTGDDEYRPKKW